MDVTEPNIGDLLPISKAQIGAGLIETVSARALHGYLEVGRDFSNWIKARIDGYGFTEGQDFVATEDLSSPDLASSKARAQRVVEYHLTLDMAKELAMVERNSKGKEARRYFIRCEQVAKAAVKGLSAREVGGIVKSGLGAFRRSLMSEVKEMIEAHAAPSGAFKTSVEFVPAVAVLEDACVPQRGRGGLVRRASGSLDRFCKREGYLTRAEAHTGRRLFHVDAVSKWLTEKGDALIRGHMDRLAGQAVMRLPPGKRRPVLREVPNGEAR